MLLSELVAYHVQTLRANRRSPATQQKYEQAECLFVDYCASTLARPPTHADLTLARARAFLIWLEDTHVSERKRNGTRTHGPLNVAFYATVLKAWSRLLTDEWEPPLWPKDPLAKLRRPSVPQPVIEILSPAEVELLLKVAGSTRQPRRDQAILAFLRYTGVRVEEACTVKLEDVQLATSRGNGRAKISGKGDKERYVYFGAKCSKYLTRYLTQERHGTAPWLFLSQRGGRCSEDAVQHMMRVLGEQAGVRGLHPHRMRHTFACRFLQKNPGKLEQLRQLLGHSKFEMTIRYAKLAEGDIEGRQGAWEDD